MTQDDFERTVKQYAGAITLTIPTSGDAAEDYDRRNAWYQNAAYTISRQPEDAIPILIDYLDKPNVQDLIKRMDADVVTIAVTALEDKPDAVIARLATFLTRIKPVDEVFETVVKHITPLHPDTVRVGAIRLIGYIDHPQRKFILQDALQNDVLHDAATHALERLGLSGGTITPIALTDEMLAKISKPAERHEVIQLGYPAIPALMNHVAEKPYTAYGVGALVIYKMPHDNLFEQMQPYTTGDNPAGVRAAAVEVIGMLDHPQRGVVLAEAIEDEAPAVIEAVLRTADVEADVVARFLGHENKRIHNMAAGVLFRMGDPRGYILAYQLAEVDSHRIRMDAVEKLVQIITEPEARDHLSRLKDDPEADVQQKARDAIQRLRNHPDKQVSRWAKRNS